VGLRWWTVQLPDADAVAAAQARLEAAGYATAPVGGGFEAGDPWGTPVRVVVG
jgi:hypothetical protein